MDFKVDYKQAESKEQAYELAKAEITPEYVAKFNIPCNIEYAPENGLIQAKGKGFTLSLEFTDSACEVSLELSFMLKPFKGKVLETIERKLEKTV